MSFSAVAVRRFRIQYVSDLHLEFYDKVAFPLLVRPVARYLALAGDIGQPAHRNYDAFLSYCSTNWDKVFYVQGNHEYYGAHFMKWPSTRTAAAGSRSPPELMSVRQAAIEEIVGKYSNVHLLTEEAPSTFLAKEGVAIIGQTLWTEIPESLWFTAATYMNDYNHIASRQVDGTPERLSPAEVNRMHRRQKAILAAQIEYWRLQKTPVCVITHHMPSLSLISPRFEGHKLNCCFASPCDELMGDPVRAWIYGHTHNVATGMIDRTFTAVNARGYPQERIVGFSPEAVLEFKVGDGGIEDECGGVLPELAAAAVGPLSSAAPEEHIEFM